MSPSSPGRRFRFHADGPDEAQQFASYGGDDLALVYAGRSKLGAALVQAQLRLKRDPNDEGTGVFTSGVVSISNGHRIQINANPTPCPAQLTRAFQAACSRRPDRTNLGCWL